MKRYKKGIRFIKNLTDIMNKGVKNEESDRERNVDLVKPVKDLHHQLHDLCKVDCIFRVIQAT